MGRPVGARGVHHQECQHVRFSQSHPGNWQGAVVFCPTLISTPALLGYNLREVYTRRLWPGFCFNLEQMVLGTLKHLPPRSAQFHMTILINQLGSSHQPVRHDAHLTLTTPYHGSRVKSSPTV